MPSRSVLIGVTGVFGLFTEDVVRAMAAGNEAPIILPLSNPTSRAEATAEDVLTWTDGKALVATGSPFTPVELNGVTYTIAQSNNSYIFPGVGLGVRASKATRVSDEMFMAAATALAASVDAQKPGDSLLPPLTEVREVSRKIAIAVGLQAQADGNAPSTTPEELERLIDETMWDAQYRPFVYQPPDPSPDHLSNHFRNQAEHTSGDMIDIDLLNYKPLGDKENSPFFEEYLPKVYERRAASGLDELVREMAAVVVQVEHGDAVKYIAELAVMGPYRLIDSRPHRHAPGVPAALAARVPAPDRARAVEPRLRGRDHPVERAVPAVEAQAERPLHRRDLQGVVRRCGAGRARAAEHPLRVSR